MNCFQKSGTAAALYHLFLFVFTLGCGWLVSALLDAAMAFDGPGAARTAAYLAVALAAGLPAVYFWRKTLGRLLRQDRQRFRERQYAAVIDRRLPIDNTGELDVRLDRDADAAADCFQSALPLIVENVGVALGAAALLCRTHLGLGMLLSALSLVQLLPSVVYETWAKEIYEQSGGAEEDLDSWFVQGYNGLTGLKSYRQEDWFLRRVEENTAGMIRAGYRSERTATVERVAAAFIDGLLRYGSYVILGLFVLYGGLRVSDTPVLIVLSGYLFGAVGMLLEALEKVFEYQAAKKHLEEIPPARVGQTDGAPLEARGVCKRWENKAVLEDVSLTVRPSQRVLVSGANGSGKTTLLRILLGLLPADAGAVRHGSGRLSFALQEEAGLTLTGRELAGDLLAEEAVDGGKLREYLQGFGITDGLMDRPLTEWSMGERKKFYLAAAFARNGDLLALDEPTNHLDGPAKAYLSSLLSSFPGAVLAVSHRDGLSVDWDLTVTLKGGQET